MLCKSNQSGVHLPACAHHPRGRAFACPVHETRGSGPTHAGRAGGGGLNGAHREAWRRRAGGGGPAGEGQPDGKAWQGFLISTGEAELSRAPCTKQGDHQGRRTQSNPFKICRIPRIKVGLPCITPPTISIPPHPFIPPGALLAPLQPPWPWPLLLASWKSKVQLTNPLLAHLARAPPVEASRGQHSHNPHVASCPWLGLVVGWGGVGWLPRLI
jgi:hypothetical protein